MAEENLEHSEMCRFVLAGKKRLKIDLYAFSIVKSVICETNIVLGPWPILHSSFHTAFKNL